MKKIFMLSMVAMLCSLTASAQFYPDGRPIHPSKRGGYYQRHERPRHSIPATYTGVRFGLGLGTVNSDSPYLDATDVKAGFYGGLAFGVSLSYNNPIFFETGVYFSQKGGKSE